MNVKCMTGQSLEEFLAAEHLPAEPACNSQELFSDPWAALVNTIHARNVADMGDCQPFSTQTQNQILAMWRTEFETPQQIKNVPRTESPATPALFDCSLEDEDYSATLLQARSSSQPLSPTFKTAGGKTIPPPSPAHRQKARGLLDGAALGSADDAPVSFVSFSTASGKKVKSPSKEAIARADRILLQSIPEEFGLDRELEVEEPEAENVAPPAAVGFTTASGKRVKSPSKAAIKKGQAIWESGAGASATTPAKRAISPSRDVSPAEERAQEKAQSFGSGGFTTASGKRVKSPSKEAIENARVMFEAADAPTAPNHFGTMADEGSVPIAFGTTNRDGSAPAVAGFTTAAGKTVKNPSKEAMERANELLATIAADSTPPLESSATGFSSASRRAIASPSASSVIKSSRSMKSLASSSPMLKRMVPGNRPFKPPTLLDPLKPLAITNSIRPSAPISPLRPPTIANHPRPPTMTRPFKPPTMINPFKSHQGSPAKATRGRTNFLTKLGTSTSLEDLAPRGPVFDLATVPLTRRKLCAFDIAVRKPVWPLKIPLSAVKERLPYMPDRWISNHMALIDWKLASYEAVGILGECGLQRNVASICSQLCYRYEREVRMAHRSILKRIAERDDSPSAYMILFVHSIDDDGDTIKMSVSDGWYVLEVIQDMMIERLVRSRRIEVGHKLKVALAQVVSDEACDVLDAGERGAKLRICGNSTRPARWSAKLGKQQIPMFIVSLASIDADGGTVACVQVAVVRRYPALYTVEWEGGRRRTVNQEQLDELTRHEFNSHDSGKGEAQERIAAVRMMVKFRVADCSGCPRPSTAVITLWDSNPEMHSRLTEGTVLRIVGLKPSIRKMRTVYMSSMRTTQIVFVKGGCPAVPVPTARAPLSAGEIIGIDQQEDYDIVGVVLSTEAGHLWLAIGSEARLVAVKMAKGRVQLGMFQPVCLLDVSFLYHDPRHSFPVFLFGDLSQLILDAGKMPQAEPFGDHQALEATRRSLLSIIGS